MTVPTKLPPLSPAQESVFIELYGNDALRRLGDLTAAGEWDESKHPRDAHGRFGDTGELIDPTSYVQKWDRGSLGRLDPRLPHNEAAAVDYYTRKYVAKDLNASLRNGEPLDDEQRVLTQLMDRAIEHRTTGETLQEWQPTGIGYRGIATDHEFKVGDEFVDHGFVSMATAKDSAELFSSGAFGTQSAVIDVKGRTPWLAEFEVPPETHFARGAAVIDEHILARDTRFRVVDVGPPLGANDYGKSRSVKLEIVQ